jgi:hypothetical protein
MDYSSRWKELLERHSALKDLYNVVKLCCVVLAAYIVFCLLFVGYASLDENGWLSHSHDTPVWIQGDWLVGEYRECDMQTTTPAFEGSNYSGEVLKTLPRLFCAKQDDGLFVWSETRTGTDMTWQTISGDFHTLPVSYFGRLERPDKWRISWRCQRLSGSLECKAVN